MRSHGKFLLNLRRSLVGLPHRTRPWLAPQISDYWAAVVKITLLRKANKRQRELLIMVLLIYSLTAISSLQFWPVPTNLNCCRRHKLLLAHAESMTCQQCTWSSTQYLHVSYPYKESKKRNVKRVFWRVSYSLCWLRLNPNKHISSQTKLWFVSCWFTDYCCLPVSHLWDNEVLPIFMIWKEKE